MSVTYFVALPFIGSEEGPVPAEAVECPNEGAALLKAEAMSRKEGVVGSLAFKRTGNPNEGSFGRSGLSQRIWTSFESTPNLRRHSKHGGLYRLSQDPSPERCNTSRRSSGRSCRP
jgi:hypothetical protein